MARRSRAREVALQLLFQRDQNRTAVRRRAIEQFVRDRLRDPDLIKFALALYDGVIARQQDIDRSIAATAENWRLPRMMPADRNVLRLGCYELLHDPEPSPTAAVINEAIELAHRFGTADSPAFVNGILDKLARSREKKAEAEPAPALATEPPVPAPADPSQ